MFCVMAQIEDIMKTVASARRKVQGARKIPKWSFSPSLGPRAIILGQWYQNCDLSINIKKYHFQSL